MVNMIFDKDGLVIDEFDNETEAEALIIECAMLDTFSNEELEARKQTFTPYVNDVPKGYLAKYQNTPI